MQVSVFLLSAMNFLVLQRLSEGKKSIIDVGAMLPCWGSPEAGSLPDSAG